jgi:hypothetical protein
VQLALLDERRDPFARHVVHSPADERDPRAARSSTGGEKSNCPSNHGSTVWSSEARTSKR